MTFPEAARMLNQAGYYLDERARYAEAEPMYRRALAIREEQLGLRHPDTAKNEVSSESVCFLSKTGVYHVSKEQNASSISLLFKRLDSNQ